MRLLLDTHLLLWATATQSGPGSPLSVVADALIDDEDNELFFSPASIWEVAIKFRLRRPDFSAHPRTLRRALLDNDYQEIPVTGGHAAGVAELPLLHRDPFDRLLIAQAIAEGMTLLTADAKVARYEGPIQRV